MSDDVFNCVRCGVILNEGEATECPKCVEPAPEPSAPFAVGDRVSSPDGHGTVLAVHRGSCRLARGDWYLFSELEHITESETPEAAARRLLPCQIKACPQMSARKREHHPMCPAYYREAIAAEMRKRG